MANELTLTKAQLAAMPPKAQKALEDRKKLLRDMSPELRREVVTIAKMYARFASRAPEFFYELGERLWKIRAESESAREKIEKARADDTLDELPDTVKNKYYGESIAEKIGEIVGFDASVVRKATAFYESFESSNGFAVNVKTLEDLCAARMLSGQPITWSHIIPLLPMDREQRGAVLARIISESLSIRELAHIVKAEFAISEVPAKGGRPLMRPKTVRAGLRQMISVTDDWLKRNREIWTTGTTSVLQELMDTPTDEYDQKLTAELEQASNALTEMKAACIAAAAKLQAVIDHVDQVDEVGEVQAPEPMAQAAMKKAPKASASTKSRAQQAVARAQERRSAKK
jgi:hypothetical protein